MKTGFIKYSICICIIIAGNAVIAQDKTEQVRTSGYTSSKNEPGEKRETINSLIGDTAYKLEMLNEKITAFYVNGTLIPADEYNKYETVIAKIKEQLRLDRIQAKKDQQKAMEDQKEAMKDEQQAKIDQKQAMKDQQQAKLMQEKSVQDQHQAKLEQEQASKDEVQAKLDQEQATKDQALAKQDMEMAAKDQQQAKLDAEQAKLDQKKAKLDQEQAMRDQAMAKLDQKQAEEDQRLVKQLINDLIKDGMVTDEKSLFSVTLSATEMTVNDKKQPDEVYKRYKMRYPRFATGHFSFDNSADGNKSIHMNRQ